MGIIEPFKYMWLEFQIEERRNRKLDRKIFEEITTPRLANLIKTSTCTSREHRRR